MSQRGERQTYSLTFPTDLKSDHVARWLRAVSGTLTTGPRRLFGVSFFVLEVEATEAGIVYRLRVPRDTAEYVVSQLRSSVPGSTVMPAGADDRHHPWTTAVELGRTNTHRSLGPVDAEALSASLLTTMQGLGAGEALLFQWVLSPALRERLPQQGSDDQDGRRAVHPFGDQHDRDAVADRRTKLSEPNFLGVLRLASQAGNENRAVHLVSRVQKSLAGVGTADNRWHRRHTRPSRVVERVHQAAAPLIFPAQVSASELVGLLAWPIGNPYVSGLPQSRTRHLAATGAIPRTGRVIARSNFPGNERLLALSVVESAQHLQVVGPTGSGKTALLSNLIAQDMNADRGVILIESKGDLFRETVARVPEHRVHDVVLLDVGDTEYPVGFNILQGSPYAVAADIQRLFDHLYPQDARGVRVRQGFYHLILTLMMGTTTSAPMTFADMGPLAVPTPDQVAFSTSLVRGVSHVEELRQWWAGVDDRTRGSYFQPLMDRIWQLNNRRSIRNIIGQSTSTIDLGDIIRSKKILLVNLGRATEGKETAGLLGSLLLNSLWSVVQSGVADPGNPTMLYLDEFQDFLNLPISPADMFAQARSLGLAMTVAHQFLGQLTRELQDATQNNARSTVVFQTSADEAKHFARGFGRTATEDDFMNLQRFEVIARLATGAGVSAPVTGVTLRPGDETGLGNEVRRLSRATYGRPATEVEAEISQRRGVRPVATTPATTRRKFGGKAWNEE